MKGGAWLQKPFNHKKGEGIGYKVNGRSLSRKKEKGRGLTKKRLEKKLGGGAWPQRKKEGFNQKSKERSLCKKKKST